jgi:Ca-activated chloride channel family protein
LWSELINYFHFAYPAPRSSEPFSVTTEVAACPWNAKHRLALVGLQARPIDPGKTPARNLVFLLDVSGSMDSPDKLPLVTTAMRMLADTLTAEDRVAIVVYAGASGLALRSTPGDRKVEIQQAIAELTPGGSTNGAAGIRLAYDTAAAHFIKGGINSQPRIRRGGGRVRFPVAQIRAQRAIDVAVGAGAGQASPRGGSRRVSRGVHPTR